jgi:predicted DNA-binding transcriptional regulator YafY
VEKLPARRRWGTEQRLEFIEFRLFWDGIVNRSDITDRFGVSVPQASADLTQYRELAPENIRYDASRKRYLRTGDFRPRLLKPNAERYLAQLRALSDEVIAPHETWIGQLPEVGVAPVPARRVEPETLRTFLAAVRGRRSISIEYQSLNDSRPEPIWRVITPHAFGSDGLRWHLRAYCHIEHVFKDFIISRCLQIGKMDEPGASPTQDRDWFTFFNVVLVPNPKLSPAQRKTIERDYGMNEGRCELRIRLAMLYYLDKRLRLDIAEKQDRPKETPIVVANRQEYDAALGRVFY